jgi:hypothetical protein
LAAVDMLEERVFRVEGENLEEEREKDNAT